MKMVSIFRASPYTICAVQPVRCCMRLVILQTGLKTDGTYPFMFSKNIYVDGLESDSKYVFQYCRNVDGFASCEIGNKLTDAEQWAKIDLVREISEEVWG